MSIMLSTSINIATYTSTHLFCAKVISGLVNHHGVRGREVWHCGWVCWRWLMKVVVDLKWVTGKGGRESVDPCLYKVFHFPTQTRPNKYHQCQTPLLNLTVCASIYLVMEHKIIGKKTNDLHREALCAKHPMVCSVVFQHNFMGQDTSDH